MKLFYRELHSSSWNGPSTPCSSQPSEHANGVLHRNRLQRSAEVAVLVAEHPEHFRVLTGERPTGPLHLGHYFGTIRERVRLQQAGVEMFLVLTDYQVITDRDTMAHVRENVYSTVLDYLAAGIDPERTTIFAHSSVPALNQLMLPFLSVVTEAELHRNPAGQSGTRRRPGAR